MYSPRPRKTQDRNEIEERNREREREREYGVVRHTPRKVKRGKIDRGGDEGHQRRKRRLKENLTNTREKNYGERKARENQEIAL